MDITKLKKDVLASDVLLAEEKDKITIDSKGMELIEVEFKEGNEIKKQPGAKIVLVEGGWNLNDIFITDVVLDQLPDFAMRKPKLFIDHDEFASIFGRQTKEWLGTFVSVERKGNQVIGTFVFTENPLTKWIHSECKRDPENVHFSIHFFGPAEEYEDEEQKREGYKILAITRYNSTDVVTYGAAGGKAIEAYNSHLNKKLNNINEIIDSKTQENQMEIKSAAELKKQFPGLVQEIIQSAMDDTEKDKKLEEANVSLAEAQTKITSFETTVQEKDEEIASKSEEVVQLSEKVTNLEKERDDLQVKLDEYQVKEKKEAWKKEVETALSESDLDDKAVTDVFKNLLLKQDKIEDVKQLIEDRETTLSTGTVENGNPANTKNKSEDAEKITDDDLVASITG